MTTQESKTVVVVVVSGGVVQGVYVTPDIANSSIMLVDHDDAEAEGKSQLAEEVEELLEKATTAGVLEYPDIGGLEDAIDELKKRL